MPTSEPAMPIITAVWIMHTTPQLYHAVVFFTDGPYVTAEVFNQPFAYWGA